MLHMSENAGIAERLRQALAVRGMSQADLERASDVSKPHISRLLKGERGEGMRKETREKLARALDVPAAWLFAGVGPSPFGDEPPPSQPAPRAETTDAMIAARIADSVGRYPSKAGAAAALRAMGVSEGAIVAMLTEEHSGSDVDPGRKAWIDSGMWWEGEIRTGRSRLERGDFTDAPTMEPRPKKRTK